MINQAAYNEGALHSFEEVPNVEVLSMAIASISERNDA
jgi:hypothetical protein